MLDVAECLLRCIGYVEEAIGVLVFLIDLGNRLRHGRNCLVVDQKVERLGVG